MKMLWCEFGLKPTYFLFFNFLIFWSFSAFVRIFGGDYLSNASKKAHGYNLHIFIFVLVCILFKNSTQSYKKRSFVNLKKVCHLLS